MLLPVQLIELYENKTQHLVFYGVVRTLFNPKSFLEEGDKEVQAGVDNCEGLEESRMKMRMEDVEILFGPYLTYFPVSRCLLQSERNFFRERASHRIGTEDRRNLRPLSQRR